MEEIIQEALSKGVEMHVAGEFDLAGQLYESVIKLQPNHADANHNMGLLKLDMGNDLEALPYLQTALQLDTSIAQFWLSYIKALINLERLDEAGRILDLAKENGIEGEEIVALNQVLNSSTGNASVVAAEIDKPSHSEPNIFDSLKLNQALRLTEKVAKKSDAEKEKMISNTTWIAGTPRTGSMLTFNIAREIFRINGRNIKPQNVPQSDAEMISRFRTEACSDVNPSNYYIFKVHTTLKTDLPKSKYIVNIRNPFEICASFYQFMKCDINMAITVAKNHSAVVKHYQNCAENQIMFVRFEDLERNLAATVEKLASFLEADMDIITAQQITSKFSKNSVKELIDKKTKNLEEKLSLNQTIKSESIVGVSDTNYRAFDVNTGFQTGHISKKNSRDWFKLFNKEEISLIKSELIEHAEKLGYQ